MTYDYDYDYLTRYLPNMTLSDEETISRGSQSMVLTVQK